MLISTKRLQTDLGKSIHLQVFLSDFIHRRQNTLKQRQFQVYLFISLLEDFAPDNSQHFLA